jgi:hypothetical protein
MIYRGIAKGRNIELDEPLPYPKGQPIQVSVEPLTELPHRGSSVAILKAMQGEPHLNSKDVDELERAIAEGKLPVQQEEPSRFPPVLNQ